MNTPRPCCTHVFNAILHHLMWFNAPWLVYLYFFKFSFRYKCHNDTPIGGIEKLTWKWIITLIILVVVVCMICVYWSDCVRANFKICDKASVRATEWKVYHPWQASCLWTRLQQKTEVMTNNTTPKLTIIISTYIKLAQSKL